MTPQQKVMLMDGSMHLVGSLHLVLTSQRHPLCVVVAGYECDVYIVKSLQKQKHKGYHLKLGIHNYQIRLTMKTPWSKWIIYECGSNVWFLNGSSIRNLGLTASCMDIISIKISHLLSDRWFVNDMAV